MGTTTTTAAKGLPTLSDISAPRFSIVTKAIGSAGQTGDGRRRFRATASSTIKDRAGDEISRKALEQMAAKFREGVTIFTDHKNEVENAYGMTDGAQIIQRGNDSKTGAAIWDLDIEGTVNDPNPKAKQLHDSIEGGFVRLGCSIDAFVLEHEPKRSEKGLLIDGLDVFAASIVGVPMNQRSWTQKAVRAIKGFYGEPEDQEESMGTETENAASEAVVEAQETIEKESEGTGVVMEGIEAPADGTEVEIVGDEAEVVEKGDMSAKTRNNLDDSQFACPEKRKYPINDKAHVRAALSRIADPNNDQCGKAKILAAARKMGIGQHGKSDKDIEGETLVQTDDELLSWALGRFDDEGNEVAVEKALGDCPDCGHSAGCDCTTCDCGAAMHGAAQDDAPMDGKSVDALDDPSVITKEATEGGQEADPAATPETAPDADDETDPAAVRKGISFEADDVVELVGNVRKMAGLIAERDEVIVALRKDLSDKQTQIDRLTSENEEVGKAVEKIMRLPLRPQAVGHLASVQRSLPSSIAPEVKEYLNRTAGDIK